jgi:molybdate transport system substrate-binding protein
VNSRTPRRVIVLMIALATFVALCEPTRAEPLTIGAPPSLRAAFDEIIPMFEQEYGVSVKIAYTPSKTLLRQIEKGARIDVFVSAGVEEVDYLYKKRLTLNGRPRVLAETSLVLVMSADSTAPLNSFRNALGDHTTRIALANPDTSYLGEVTARALNKLYPTYKSREHILYASHSEQILNLVRAGKADLGLVYRANMISNGDVRISDDAPIGSDVVIEFAQAVVSGCEISLRSLAVQFSDFLMTPRIQLLLMKHGFNPPHVGPTRVKRAVK